MDSTVQTPCVFDCHYIDQDPFAEMPELPPLSFSDFSSFNSLIEGFNDVSDEFFSFDAATQRLPLPPLSPPPLVYEDIGINVKQMRSSASDDSGHFDTASGSSGSNWWVKDMEIRSGSGRRRAGQLELEEIQKYFDVPICKAAKEMNVGLTLLKRRCRELNIMRWPHRKIKSLKTLINNVKEMGLDREIVTLEQHKRVLERVPDMELSERTKKLRQACFKANYKKRICLAASTPP